MDEVKQKKIDETLIIFNRQIARIFKLCDSKDKENIDIYYLKKIISSFRQIDPTLVLKNCTNKLWDNREKIIKRDLDFFQDPKSYSKYIKEDENKSFIYGLISLVSKEQKKLTEGENTYIWNCINLMLECVTKYRIIMGDFDTT